jgi:Fe2+ or Zn2+ uptake regulation protein
MRPRERGPAESVADLERRSHERGIPLTVQRRAVLASLAARDDHPTAEEVYADLRARLPGIAKATAYRTLDTLVQLGLVVRVSHPGSAARYDAKTWRHHHVVCDACGAMSDLDSKALDAVRLPDLRARGFYVRDFSVYVRGLCAACVPAAPSAHRPRRRAGPARQPTGRSGRRPTQQQRRKP